MPSKLFPVYILFICLIACQDNDLIVDVPQNPVDEVDEISDTELLDLTQRETFNYFWDFAESNSGAIRERYHPDQPSLNAHVVTSGGTGFGLMAMLVGIERGYVGRSEATDRIKNILSFLDSSDRFHGAWSHWIDGRNGKVIPFSAQDDGGDLVETAFLAQGLICIAEYFKNGTDSEKEISKTADDLWKGIDWKWYTRSEKTLYWHWSPNHDFSMNFKLSGYNETLITYIMAAASTSYGISKDVYTNGWAMNGNIMSSENTYGYPLLVSHHGAQTYGGPLFWAHYSYLGLNPNGLEDEFVNYGDVNINHTKINLQYCISNPKQFPSYGQNCWGLTASYSKNTDGSIGYSAHSPNNDLGIISPTAALSSMPYTPQESMKALRYFYSKKDKLLGPAGFYDAFKSDDTWVAEAYLAIDQGPIIVMIENHRSGMLWNLFMGNSDVQAGLDKLGFSYEN
ncbi:MAG: glucoamylase family protein [Lutimonas sp.]